MGQRTQYSPGTFSWTDLSTPDQEASKRFYSGLFGWTMEDRPVDEGVVYTMAALRGAHVAALTPQPQQQREAGVPPLWNSYITVTSADDTLARATELGGHVHAGPFDVFDAGRMGVVQDPQGAFFMVWQPLRNPGAGIVNEPGALSWNELSTPDPEDAVRFYGELFGWTFNKFDMPGFDYWVIMRPDGHSNGGLHPPTSPEEPPGWLVYFACEDLEASIERAGELGGGTIAGPMPVGPDARIAVMRDEQGAVFALYAGRLDD